MTLFPNSTPTTDANGSGRKLRGGYYTPAAIADFLAGWAVRSASDRVFEPSCGDGALVDSAARLLGDNGEIVGVELVEAEAAKARARGGSAATVVTADVFRWWLANEMDGSFDAVIGNPPFIRYQDFPEEYRKPAFDLMRAEGLRPTRLSNAWLPFVVLATRALRSGGRLALVVPAELMQVGYAGELRQYLTRKFDELHIVTFRKIVFEGIQQEVVLLLGSRADCTSARISVEELDKAHDLASLDIGASAPVEVDLEHSTEKWTQYFLEPQEIDLLRCLAESSDVPRLSRYGEVNVGIVTGRNNFFVLSRAAAKEFDIEQWCVPLVGRSYQIPGLVLSKQAWIELHRSDDKVLLLKAGHEERSELPPSLLRYVEGGEERGFHTGYKCRIRLPAWWQVPSAWVPDAFMLRQIYDAPRIVANGALATCTDTIHRVRAKPGVSPVQLASASVNSMTLAFSEVMGRSYGGGVLELEPREATRLPFPALNGALPADELDRLARARGTEALVETVDRLVLSRMGLSKRDVRLLRGAWKKLSLRRRNRKRS